MMSPNVPSFRVPAPTSSVPAQPLLPRRAVERLPAEVEPLRVRAPVDSASSPGAKPWRPDTSVCDERGDEREAERRVDHGLDVGDAPARAAAVRAGRRLRAEDLGGVPAVSPSISAACVLTWYPSRARPERALRRDAADVRDERRGRTGPGDEEREDGESAWTRMVAGDASASPLGGVSHRALRA